MKEFQMIAKYFEPLTSARLEAGDLKDDAAIFNLPTNHELVVTTDTIVENVHFLSTDPVETLGKKALRVNLSDLAAMGALPHAYTMNLTIPEKFYNDEFLKQFTRGLAEDQNKFNLFLAGGDTTRTDGPLTISVTAYGVIPSGLRLTRRNARPGDICAVTGTIGDSYLGLMFNRQKLSGADDDTARYFLRRFLLPEPRITFVQALEQYSKACIDISDGFLADLEHVCANSEVSIKTSINTVPISKDARNLCAQTGIPVNNLLCAGDDYELIIAVEEKNWTSLKKQADNQKLPLTAIGYFENSSPDMPNVSVTDDDGRPLLFETHGWSHFL